jgi:hypothetical protein
VDDLSSLLLSAIEETERLALAANLKQDDPEWYAHHVAGSHPRTFRVRSAQDHCPIAEVEDIESDAEVLDPTGVLDGEAAARHIAHNDPSSVLRRCAGERRAIAMCNAAIKQYERGDGQNEHEKGQVAGAYTMAFMVLTHLAEGYALTDHQEGEGRG